MFFVPLVGGLLDIFVGKFRFQRLLLHKSFEIEYFDLSSDRWRCYLSKEMQTYDGLLNFFNELSIKDIKKMIDEDCQILEKKNIRENAISDLRLRYIALHEANKV